MERDEERHLAEILREQRLGLETASTRISGQNAVLSRVELRQLLDTTTARLIDVENALRLDALTIRPARLPRLRLLLTRLRSLKSPRIGVLRHYPPRLLRVPARYQRIEMPDPAPTISIVTPSFQQGRFLERTLYSVAAQEYPSLEYIVQDGGSTDETVDILNQVGGSLTRWASEPDGGQANAINRGFASTTGEIMAWLNSDDLLLPGALAYVGSYFAAHPDVDVVYGHRIMLDENDGEIGAWILPAHDDLALTLVDFVPQETLFWRRRIWERAGGEVDERFGYALDWDLLLRFRDAGATIVRLPRFLGAFRVHEEQKTTVDHLLGDEECVRLRRRVHGRDVTIEEAVSRLRPYLRRHVLIHTRHRLVDRLRLPRVAVPVTPPESWAERLRTPPLGHPKQNREILSRERASNTVRQPDRQP